METGEKPQTYLKMKTKLNTFYIRFYRTGEFRKIEAENEEQALKIAVEKFGESTGVWKLGKLLRVGTDKVPATRILLKQ